MKQLNVSYVKQVCTLKMHNSFESQGLKYMVARRPGLVSLKLGHAHFYQLIVHRASKSGDSELYFDMNKV